MWCDLEEVEVLWRGDSGVAPCCAATTRQMDRMRGKVGWNRKMVQGQPGTIWKQEEYTTQTPGVTREENV